MSAALRALAWFCALGLLTACGEEAETRPQSATVSATQRAEGTPVVGVGPTPSAENATILALRPIQRTEPIGAPVHVKPPPGGRFFERVLPDPVSGERQTVIYDVEGALTIALGPGSSGAFSPDAKLMTWAGPMKASPTKYGSSILPRWRSDTSVRVRSPSFGAMS
jgi:hypothetical protein